MKYYAERNNLLEENFNISFEDLKQHFYKIYMYFANTKCFDVAIKGVWKKPQWEEEYLTIPPLLAPSPETFFMKQLSSNEIYPIFQYYENYTETELFTVIEILYDKICTYDYKNSVINNDVKKEFAIQINNVLQLYDDGYFLEIHSGTITKGANDPVKNMLSEDLSKILPEDIMTKTRTAIKMYYRFDSNMEMKTKAITILADILEPLRDELKDILNHGYETNKNDHDKLIFEIVNNFNIRHTNTKQHENYEHEIWYDWMIQYYSSVIITFYKLKKIKTNLQ
ncbi:hypothetical protein [Clostridium arbusti]|uniref:hypothetical protein n=1 Tax=Clostridium arbusti TaxID=1137848 RepID=UPI0002889039|nr:hypothetical protein [Clostridium arbusti]